jgi:hypothetical protein
LVMVACLLCVSAFCALHVVVVVFGLNPRMFWLGLSVFLAYRLLSCIYC